MVAAVAETGARFALSWGEFSLGQYLGLILIAVGTLVGAWLGRRWSHRSTMLLGAASGVLLAVAGADIVPHALHEAEEQGLAGWIVPVVVAASALASAGHSLRRRGEPGRLLGAGTAVALVLHRLVEGMTVALLASVPVVAALTVHSVSEGLALTAVLDARGRRPLTPWLVAVCVSPLVGGWITLVAPVPEWTHALLLAMVAGVLLRNAGTALALARRRHLAGELPAAPVLLALGSAAAVTTAAVLVLR
ncbi:ZIP family metal transporter [Streptomyces sp. YKOK-I1]